jgi:hypothetical protein
MYKLVDMRDFMDPQQGGGVRLYPYARDLYYHPSGLLSMTIQIYDEYESQDFNFGIVANGNLKDFLDQLHEGDIL